MTEYVQVSIAELRLLAGELHASAIADGAVGLRGMCIDARNRLNAILAATPPPQEVEQVAREGLVGDTRRVISALQSVRDRLMPVLAEQYGDAFDGDFDVMLDAINALKRFASAALRTQAPEPLGAVDEVKVIRDRFMRCASKLVSDDYAAGYTEALDHITAALSAKETANGG